LYLRTLKSVFVFEKKMVKGVTPIRFHSESNPFPSFGIRVQSAANLTLYVQPHSGANNVSD
jgi:hypothetical protein